MLSRDHLDTFMEIEVIGIVLNEVHSDFESFFDLFYYVYFFPGQLALCKKAVVGLAARRIF